MPTVIYPNNKIVSLHAGNKCGISTVQSYLGYPYFGDMRGRNGKADLKNKGLWYDLEQTKKSTAPIPDFRAAVIRDPISRMTSIYTDRVCRKNRENCLKDINSWDIFVTNFRIWQEKYKDIRIHSLLQSDMLLEDLTKYDNIFTTSQLGKEVREWLENIVEMKIPRHRGKDGKGASEAITVTSEQENLIKEYFAKDYEIFKNYFV